MNRATASMLISLLALLTGCSDNGGSDDTGSNQARLQIANLVSDAPALRISLNGVALATVSFSQATANSAIAAGRFRLAVTYAPSDGAAFEQLAEERRFRLTGGTETTLLIIGSIAQPELVTLYDEVDSVVADGTTEVRFVHAANAAGSMDIYISPDPASNSINGISPVSLAAGEASAPLTESSGDVRLLVTATGSAELLYDSGPMTLWSGARRLIAVVDHFGPGGPVRVLEIGRMGATTPVEEQLPAALRVAQMIPDLAGADLLVDDAIAFDSLTSDALSAYIELAPGTHTFAITREDQPLAELFSTEWQMVAGERRTLVAVGAAGSDTVTARVIRDDARGIASGARVTMVHAAPELGRLSAYLLEADEETTNTQTLFTNFGLHTSGTALVAAGDYRLVVTKAGDTETLLGPEEVTVAANGVYTFVVKDVTGGTPPGGIVLADDFAP